MKYLFTPLLMLVGISGWGQKHDYVWLSGYSAYPHPTYDTMHNIAWATTIMDFNYDTVKVTMDSLKMNFHYTNTSFCDSNGNLLFYTNGLYVANSLDEMIENGDKINDGWFTTFWDPHIDELGYRNTKGIIALEDMVNPNRYYLIHSFADSSSGWDPVIITKILVSYIDMSANNGHGKMIYKNQEVLIDREDGLGYSVGGTRHGNGRDWWVLAQKRNTNCYYRILLDTSGPNLMADLSCEGYVIPDTQIGLDCFSPDGRKYAYLSSDGGLNIFDFDRCNGSLSNPQVFIMTAIRDSAWWNNAGVSFSSSGRFLYVTAVKHIYQIDLFNPNMFLHIDTIGMFEADTSEPFSFGSFFTTPQLGPDGKIYISPGNSTQYFHVINDPDLKGDSCNFLQRGKALPGLSSGVPNFPNYRLGRLEGSGCDTLTGLNETARTEKEKILKVFPNPATTDVMIDYGFTDWSKPGAITMEITNELGQMVHQQALPRYSGFQKIDVSQYPSGFYLVHIKRNNQVIATSKFAKQ